MSMETTKILPQDPVITENSVLGLQDTSHIVYNRNASTLTIKGSVNQSTLGKRSNSKDVLVPTKTDQEVKPISGAVQRSHSKYNTVKEKVVIKPPVVFG